MAQQPASSGGLSTGRGASSMLSLGAPRTRKADVPFTASGGRPPLSASSSQRADAAIRSTDNDAMGSRLSAIMQGYIDRDPFTQTLASSEASTSATLTRRAPIINIGTYLRSQSIDELVDRFLSEGGTTAKQIISVGAGSDSRFWRLYARRQTLNVRHYIELDFPELTKAKVERIVRHKHLAEAVKQMAPDEDPYISSDRACLQTAQYSLLSCDLRTLPSDESAKALLQRQLDPSLDTLIIAECVLAYLSPSSSEALLSFFGSILLRPCGVCYEMCVAGETQSSVQDPSRFGTVMLSNLESRGLSMPGARAYSTPSSHARRFEKTFGSIREEKGDGVGGQGHGLARTLKQVWHLQSDEEKARLSRIEGLDEVEELDMLLSHYAVSWYAYDAILFPELLKSTL